MKPLLPLALLAAATVAAARDPIRLDLRPTFSGPGAGTNAITVTVENDGPALQGTLRVENGGNGVAYPVEVEHGANKEVLTLTGSGDGREPFFVLNTDHGNVSQWLPPAAADNLAGGTALLVGDDREGLSFLREKVTEGRETIVGGDAYVSPEEAPARAAAYSTFDAVVVAPGAERLGNATVAALKEYALSGGTLVFLGGKRSVVLSDARWADALPGKGWHVRTAQGRELWNFDNATLGGTFDVVEPTTIAVGASEVTSSPLGSTFQTARNLGLGRAVVLGYSLLDRPFDEWDGRLRAFSPLVHGGTSQRAHRYLDVYLNQTVSRAGSFQHVGWANGGSERSPQLDDPFSTKLPAFGTVFGLLAGYFVLVVPASFLVLRRLKRGELAWVTAPLLSLGFAGALFRSADGLYAAKLSTASQGVVVLQEGFPGATFYGTSQMFFPKGGTYDLKLRNVDQLEAVGDTSAFGSDALAGFNAVDDGQVRVPALEASNLAFREMSYAQRVPDADWFRIRPLDADHTVVENRSPYAFNGSLMSGSRGSVLFKLQPGQAKTVVNGPAITAPRSSVVEATDPHNFTDRGGRIALSGTLDGFRPGPQIGESVRSGVSVIAFGQETTR